ncbi:serpin family protein [Plastoroseomonas hellenica]|uniref:serpin family protein n=1 Tax=Plastoroseomonas hellenica TaxID=2687306 RepID=UPI001BAA24BC|nr:serpin family protein [Plastoroseomonas hellenica]MBR0645989.1 serpin family protein [Plastoroseomonas hellenica]
MDARTPNTDWQSAALAEAPASLPARVNGLGERLLAAQDQDEDAVLISPLSLLDAVALLALGARGEALQQMNGLLGPDHRAAYAALHAQLGSATALRRASSAWLAGGEAPLPDYRAALTALGAEIQSVDFRDPGAVRLINAWVAARTGNLIPSLLDRLSANTALVLTAALHFAATWQQTFDPAATRTGPFRRAGGGTAEARFMTGVVTARFARGEDIHAVRLRYTTRDFELLLLAPRPDGNPSAVRTLVGQGKILETLSALRFAEDQVGVTLPKFEASHGGELLPALRRITPAFDASYTGITGRGVVVNQVRQKAVLKVDERGTEAAAATAIIAQRGISTRPVFHADAPFLAVVLHVPSGLHIVSALINLPRSA